MSLQENIEKISTLFFGCKSSKSLYEKIISLGSFLPEMDNENKVEKNLVNGCQSRTYLFTSLKGNKILIEADSDALISKGICGILYLVYNKTEPIEILKHEPTFIRDLNIQKSLSPNRSNGLIQILNKIKKDTLELYLKDHQ